MERQEFLKLLQKSRYGKYALEILEFFVPLALELPNLRKNPAIMKEKVKLTSVDGVTDVATMADIWTENKIRGEIANRHPKWQVWGEESGLKKGKDISVLVDPIEGTNNFKSYKDDQWGSVIGLVDLKMGLPRVGIVAHPSASAFYVGVLGIGAYKLKYNENGILTEVQKPMIEFDKFTYNNSPHFEKPLVAQVKKFFSLGNVVSARENSAKLEQSRKEVSIIIDDKQLKFSDPESGALEVVISKGTICFKTSNEMAAVFPIIQELGGIATDGEGCPWHFGINTLIAARNKEDYAALKKIYDKTKKLK